MNFVSTDRLTRGCPNGTVANMAIGGSFSTAVNNAAQALVNSGVFLSVAAGGNGDNAANYSPASAPLACTVGASTQSDSVATSSNYGAILDIYAPGQNIISTWLAGGTVRISFSFSWLFHGVCSYDNRLTYDRILSLERLLQVHTLLVWVRTCLD